MEDEPTRCMRLGRWLRGPVFLMYVNYFCATWASRMWSFALGLFFVVLSDKALLLSAIHGFLHCSSVLIFGSVVGKWIDCSNRLYAVRRALLAQKLCVFFSASTICVIFWYNDKIQNIWNGGLSIILQAVVVLLAVTAELATIAYQEIAIIKDWFIVTTGGSKKQLANLNAGTRASDMITNTLTPIITGQIMTSSSKFIAGIFIAVWHLVAIFVEGALLTKIYRMVPEMAIKHKINVCEEHELKNLEEKEHLNNNNGLGKELQNHSDLEKNNNVDTKDEEVAVNTSFCSRSCNSIATNARDWIKGWRVYFRQSILFAGLAMAFLFMTVLGFDSITVGYIYSNNVPENIVGIIMAMGSIAGVIGAFLFTQGRKYFGLGRTGMMSFSWQLTCLMLCVVSVYLPGSVFQPSGQLNKIGLKSSSEASITELTTASYGASDPLNSTERGNTLASEDSSYVMSQSIVVFVIGLCASRLGLWITDLVITQIIQENVTETERGIVNGTQWSLNKLMAMGKFCLVFFLPHIQTFGYLIFLTFIFISLSFSLYMIYCFRVAKVQLCEKLNTKANRKKQHPNTDSKNASL